MTWLFLTGAGLVVETVVIVVLGSTVTARFDAGDTPPTQPGPLAQGGDPGIGFLLVEDDRGALVDRVDAVGEASA